jgi:hypothetical protein
LLLRPQRVRRTCYERLKLVRQTNAAPEMKSSTSIHRRPGMLPRAGYFAAASLAGAAVAAIAKLFNLTDLAAIIWAIAVLVVFVVVATPLLLGRTQPRR